MIKTSAMDKSEYLGGKNKSLQKWVKIHNIRNTRKITKKWNSWKKKSKLLIMELNMNILREQLSLSSHHDDDSESDVSEDSAGNK